MGGKTNEDRSGSANILSQDDLNDLHGMRSKPSVGEGGEDSQGLSSLDFRLPHLFTREMRDRFLATTDHWRSEIATAWGLRSGVGWTLEASTANRLTFHEYRRSLPDPGNFMTFGHSKGLQVLLETDAALTGALARAAFGYPPVGEIPQIDSFHRHAVAGHLSATVAPSVSETFGCPPVPTHVAVTDRPVLIDLTDSLDMVILVVFTVRVENGNQEMRLRICIPSMWVAQFAADHRRSAAEPEGEKQPSMSIAPALTGHLEFPLSGLRSADLAALNSGGAVGVDASTTGYLRYGTGEGSTT